MSVVEHPDMPRGIGGIQGLSPWNLLMLNVLISWWRDRRRTSTTWDLPRYIRLLGFCYFSVVLWSFLRLASDYSALDVLNYSEYTRKTTNYSLVSITSEHLINCVKWALPGLLLYDACRSRKRVSIALFVVLSLYFLLAVQVIRYMPLRMVVASGAELSKTAAKVLRNEMGFFRIELSMMLSGGSWAVLTTLALARKRYQRLLLLGVAAAVSLGQALTGGRAGYATWGLVGLIVALVRWRWLLPYLGLAVVGICTFMPGVRDRMMQGFGGTRGNIVTHTDENSVTAGRTLAWSYVIPKIWQSPIFGYGGQAMVRTGIYQRIIDEYDEAESFPHPHNAYLELLLDNGFVGFLLVIPFYIVVLAQSFRLLVDRSDPLFGAAGGVSVCLILALLIAAMGAESFYPKESSMGMFAAIGLMLRVSVERARSRLTGEPLFGDGESSNPVSVPTDWPPVMAEI